MIPDKVLTDLSSDIRCLFEADPQNARQRIESMLKARFSDYSNESGSEAIQKLIRMFGASQIDPGAVDHKIMERVFGLLIGRTAAPDDYSSTDMLERLADSLNTIFDSLNNLISLINTSFCSENASKEKTIRQFIGFHLEGADQTKPLEEYLGKIGQAFLTTHEAFKRSAHKMVGQLIDDLDMKQIAKERGPGLKIGPLRKAEDYEIIMEKIERIRKWYDSGRCMEVFLREFEEHCQLLRVH